MEQRETLGPFTTDSTGSTYTTYVPDQIGNYTITTNFPNNTYPITVRQYLEELHLYNKALYF